MRVRTLLAIGGVVGAIGVVGSLVVEALSDDDDSNLFVLIVAGLSILILLAGIGVVAGWFGRERDDVVIVAFGAGTVVAVALAVASVVSDQIVIASVVLAGGVVIAGGVVGAVAWWIGDLVCIARDLPTARRLVAPAYAEDNPGYPLWTTDAGPAIRTTLDRLAERVAPGEPVDGRAVGIVTGLPRDVPVTVLLTGDRLTIQPVDIHGAANGEPRTVNTADITTVSMRSLRPDGIERRINAYDDLITITTADGSHTRLRLPYGTRGVGTATGGSDEIRRWLRTRSGMAH